MPIVLDAASELCNTHTHTHTQTQLKTVGGRAIVYMHCVILASESKCKGNDVIFQESGMSPVMEELTTRLQL